MCRLTMTAAAAAVMLAVVGTIPDATASRLQAAGMVPVGVRYLASSDSNRWRRDLEEMQRLRFNVVELQGEASAAATTSLLSIDLLLAGASDPRITRGTGVEPATVRVDAATTAAEVRARAWSAFARSGSVVFADWRTLLANADGLGAAADFAAAVARNTPLYAPLRPIAPDTPSRRVRVSGGDEDVTVALLESAEALVVIAVNHGTRPQIVTMTFSPDVPEAIWQNMLTGGAVNFVAGPDGPAYERAFAPHEVVVLMIRTRLR